MLSIKQVTKQFEGIKALQNVSFSVKEGEILGLVGPNGAGKTTLLNVISGICKPDSGRIIFDGVDITAEKPYTICRMGIAKTFQRVQSFPELTASENVAIGAIFGSGDKISRTEGIKKATEILKSIGFPENRLQQKAKNLNVVELKKIQLARALATNPKLLLLDEVTTGLTPKESNDAIALIHDIRKRGMTILIVEHVMRVIMNVSDRIIVLHHGRKIAEGTPQEIAEDEEVIKSYLGEKI